MEQQLLRTLSPYGDGFDLLKGVLSHQPGSNATGICETRPDQVIAVTGHFPGGILWPGVFHLAGLAELALALLQEMYPRSSWLPYQLVNARFWRPAGVEDSLEMSCKLDPTPLEPASPNVVQVRCKSKRAGKTVCTAVWQYVRCEDSDARRLRSSHEDFLFIDRPPEQSADSGLSSSYLIRGSENYSLNELYGHILWWLLWGVEGPAQAGVIALLSDPQFARQRIVFEGIRNAFFSQCPRLGELVTVSADLAELGPEATKGEGDSEMRVRGAVGAEATFYFSFIPL